MVNFPRARCLSEKACGLGAVDDAVEAAVAPHTSITADRGELATDICGEPCHGLYRRAEDRANEQTLLRNPIFITPPDVVSARLANVPLTPAVNVATNHADQFPSFSMPNP